MNELEKLLNWYNWKKYQLQRIDKFFKWQQKNFKHYNWWIPWN
jgi:hypothetical protein